MKYFIGIITGIPLFWFLSDGIMVDLGASSVDSSILALFCILIYLWGIDAMASK